MLAYSIRRILLMIPTFIGILIINFGVLRLQGPTLVEQMQAGGGAQPGLSAAGERKAQGAAKDVENYIDRFRRSGIDLPALMNFRPWYSKEQYVRWIRDTSANGKYKETPSKRNILEKELWLTGPQAIEPLVAILSDESLADLHAPTSLALSYCGYVTLSPRDLQRMTGEEIQ
jgi:ABC-type dipeptide/oligopeptide/nickel transport system permease component